MPSLQIRDFPQALHSQLVRRARLERRTIAQEATVLLAEALSPPSSEKDRRRAILDEIKRRPAILDFSRITPPEDLIRADRDR
jgi:hypothetical protein